MALPLSFDPRLGTESALEFSSLQKLRQQAHTGVHAEQTQAEVARQFEALLIAQLLNQTRQASEASGMAVFDSPQTQMAQSLGDAQLAQQLSNPGLGLAQALLAQMRRTPTPEVEGAGTVSGDKSPPIRP